jgi:thioredoxin 1
VAEVTWIGGLLAALVFAWIVGMPLYAKRRARAAVGRAVPSEGPSIDPARPALVYFFSPTCAPCKHMSPIVDSFAKEGVAVHRVDVSTAIETAMAWQVMMTPTTVVVREGRITDVVLGVERPEQLRARLA